MVRERNLPVPPPAIEHAQQLPHPQLDAAVVGRDYLYRYEIVPDLFEELEELVEHDYSRHPLLPANLSICAYRVSKSLSFDTPASHQMRWLLTCPLSIHPGRSISTILPPSSVIRSASFWKRTSVMITRSRPTILLRMCWIQKSCRILLRKHSVQNFCRNSRVLKPHSDKTASRSNPLRPSISS